MRLAPRLPVGVDCFCEPGFGAVIGRRIERILSAVETVGRTAGDQHIAHRHLREHVRGFDQGVDRGFRVRRVGLRALRRHSELDDGFAELEKADQNLAADLGFVGVLVNTAVSQHAPVPDLTVDVSGPGAILDQLGQRIFFSALQNVNVAKIDITIVMKSAWYSRHTHALVQKPANRARDGRIARMSPYERRRSLSIVANARNANAAYCEWLANMCVYAR